MIFRATEYNLIFNAPTSGRTWDVYVSKDGGNYALTITSSASDFVGDGSYHFYASASDMDANIINFKIVENNSVLYYDEPMQYEINITTDDPTTYAAMNYLNQLSTEIQTLHDEVQAIVFPGVTPSSSTVVWTYTIYTDQNYDIPLENCLVKMTEDIDGNVDLKEQYTNVAGETRWLVVPGTTYYLWRQKDNWRFENPDVQTIGLIYPFASTSSSINQPSPDMHTGEYLGDGGATWTYSVYQDIACTIPLEDCWVRLTKDIGGDNNLGEQFTDALGKTTWSVIPGDTYYLWRQKKNYSFTDPDVQTINLVEPYSNEG